MDSRKAVLRDRMSKLEVPPYAYLPLCSSLSPYRGILRVVAPEAHAFTTKARVPAMMIFEVEVHPEHRDAATFLGAELHEYSDSRTLSPSPPVTESVAAPGTPTAMQRGSSIGSESSVESQFEPIVAKSASLKFRMGWKDTKSAKEESTEEASSAAANLTVSDITRPITPGSESFKEKANRVRQSSPFKDLAGWKLDGLIAKSNDDVRQEVPPP